MSNIPQELYALSVKASESSPNRGTKVGAVIYNPTTQARLISACNTLPRGMSPTVEGYHQKPLKGMVWEHAERDAIFAAAYHGIRLSGMGMAVNWYPCAECARAIVQSGITELVASEPDWTDDRWNASWLAAKDILFKGMVSVFFVDGPGGVTSSAPGTPNKGGILINWPGARIEPIEPSGTPLPPLSFRLEEITGPVQ